MNWCLAIYFSVGIIAGRAAITDYFKDAFSYFQNNEQSNSNEVTNFQQQVPYELSLTDEKFIADAIKLTGVGASELDKCQHRVVLQLQTACHQMNDEQLAKMAVMLLNCQSAVEGRQTYPCTDSMSLKDCTIDMDSIAWNTYHIMSNRARAVCYYVRNLQFRGLTEQTVNRLMHSAQAQIQKLHEISEDQKNLQDITHDTLDTISKGYKDLHERQEDIQRAQLHGQLTMEDNIKRLSDEKFLIKENRELLAALTTNLNSKLENALSQLDAQSAQNKVNHKELISDILRIQNVANVIFKQIDESSKLLLQQNNHAQLQFNLTIEHLKEMNKTVNALVGVIGGTKQALEDRLIWITEILGGTDVALDRLYAVLWHFLLLTGGMIVCAFLNAGSSIRLMICTAMPLNLGLYFYYNDRYLGPIGLIALIGSFIFLQTVAFYAMKLKRNAKITGMISSGSTFANNNVVNNKSANGAESPYMYENGLKEVQEEEEEEEEEAQEEHYFSSSFSPRDTFLSPTPPLSIRNGFSRSRSVTPLLNRSRKATCTATTRLGTPCKITALPGRDYCHRHQNGDSVMG